METTPSSRPQERDHQNPSPTTSPNSNGGGGGSTVTTTGSPLHPTPPHTPKPVIVSRSSNDTNPYPTTFVQADTTTFKQVVQMLTGSSDTARQSDHAPPARSIPPIKSAAQKRQGFKLYERRNSLKNGLMINTLPPGFNSRNGFSSPRKHHEILSPSILDFPALVLSPETPLIGGDSLSESTPSPPDEEEKAIAAKKFYFHPSPRNTEPQLLPLFPVTSPRVSGSSF